MRGTLALAVASLLVSPVAAQTLPGTKPLTGKGDRAAQMVAGIDKYLTRELARLDNTVEAEVNGTEAICATILAGLVETGYQIVEFRQRKVELEEVFMNVTKGELR